MYNRRSNGYCHIYEPWSDIQVYNKEGKKQQITWKNLQNCITNFYTNISKGSKYCVNLQINKQFPS